MEFRQLLPEQGIVDPAALIAGLELAERAPDDRPYTIVNFVSSVDGRATFAGRSGQLGDEGDRVMFHSLRHRVDAVLAGTMTLKIERYGRIVGDAEVRERRVERGLRPEPLACVVSRSGMVPTDIPLFEEPESTIVLFSAGDVDLGSPAAHVEVVRLDPGELTFVTVLRCLHERFEVRSLLCEGGPTLFGALLAEGVVDELFLTLAPKLTGGGRGPTITSGPELAEPANLELMWLLERAGSLYLRYARSV